MLDYLEANNEIVRPLKYQGKDLDESQAIRTSWLAKQKKKSANIASTEITRAATKGNDVVHYITKAIPSSSDTRFNRHRRVFYHFCARQLENAKHLRVGRAQLVKRPLYRYSAMQNSLNIRKGFMPSQGL